MITDCGLHDAIDHVFERLAADGMQGQLRSGFAQRAYGMRDRGFRQARKPDLLHFSFRARIIEVVLFGPTIKRKARSS
jgi:hypothetical protein